MKVRYSYLKQKFGNKALRKEIFREFERLLDEGDFTLGAAVETFERSFAALIGAKYAIGVANGTDALRISLKACGVGPGDEVITGANSFIASAGAIVECGARPVLVDMRGNYTLDEQQIERAITEKTKAILPVHYTGEPAEMDVIMGIARKHNLRVVEDACQGVLAEYKGVCVGNFGDAAAFSLHPLKNLNVWGDGGMITTNDPTLDRQLRLLRNHGLVDRDHVSVFGCNSRLDTLQAMVGNALIGETKRTTEQRRKNAAYYDEALQGLVTLPERRSYAKSCFHLYMFMVRPEVRDTLVSFLNAAGVEAKVHYPIPMYKQECFSNLPREPLKVVYIRGVPEAYGTFHEADRQAASVITLPVDEHLTREQQDYAISKIKEFFSV